jgi:hypothetical protein
MLTFFITHTDELMSKLYESIAAQHENVIAIYTARHPSFVSISSSVKLLDEARNLIKFSILIWAGILEEAQP